MVARGVAQRVGRSAHVGAIQLSLGLTKACRGRWAVQTSHRRAPAHARRPWTWVVRVALDDYFGVRFELLGRDEDVLAAELAVFVSFVPAIEALIEKEQLAQGRVAGAVTLLVDEELSLTVAWMDSDTLRSHVRILRHPGGA